MTQQGIEPESVRDGSGHIFQLERRERIMARLGRQGRVDVTDLADEFDVSSETIRRDLTNLQRDKLVVRVHGGAIPWRSSMQVPQLDVREGREVEEKRRIARAATLEVPESGTLLIDSGSTAAYFADAIDRTRDLTVITNSIPIVRALATTEKPDVIVIGGMLRRRTMAFVDDAGVDMLRDITVDVVFLGCDGVSAERGYTTPFREEVAIKQAMMAAARRVVMMFDHSKVGNDQLFRFADVGAVDTIITGSEVDDTAVASFEETGVTVTRV